MTQQQTLNNNSNNNVAAIEIKNLHKTFGEDNHVLKGINLTVNKGEDLVILGKSGTGKSITIKCIVGLIKADEGEIKVLGEDITKLNTQELNKIRVKVGFLFQNAALYDSMSVRENLDFTLRRHFDSLTEAEIESEIKEVLESVGLAEAIDKMPSELSGGMRKRIGLARTLILKPEIILYDEPTTGLDTITSKEISELIISIQEERKTSSIIITHDMACAKMTADRIMILKDGVIHAEGTYQELENSEEEWVRSFFI
ncbi:phospholipid/cholesterol/gamma-HCH transport system ATP-binding protein [Flavobacterium sp. 28A]|uniref:ABC transporter ATP-binding protein n=1 Tax=Flavobacterium sp. 28A TaxID=2735895 RepID=UPI0015708486|nr:ATP-binding cassette domain-containing protein [Flavobacterium sp. 28A]NRT14645.1 phospholipid/cholesterol/gamma-HCH transport system ATP-binding protein [Flavobacterium sp. 28A]